MVRTVMWSFLRCMRNFPNKGTKPGSVQLKAQQITELSAVAPDATDKLERMHFMDYILG
jgi:hypothetical protein